MMLVHLECLHNSMMLIRRMTKIKLLYQKNELTVDMHKKYNIYVYTYILGLRHIQLRNIAISSDSLQQLMPQGMLHLKVKFIIYTSNIEVMS